ncbi:1-aminocyclopropane-1-carboxylate oxidase homolog 11-like [Aristolochia californica]|uniref:1-aminocyclopropane-1-carboxylate oxidase homolog 11-like n=1 Tax=Aristolochia californica TaxID=171875 RepID=UPI0035D88AEE
MTVEGRSSNLPTVDGIKQVDSIDGLRTVAEIPIIDLGNINDLVGRQKIVAEVRSATLTWGMFQLVNHGIPQNVMEEMLEGSRRFHEDNKHKKVLESLAVPDLSKKVRLKAGFSQAGIRRKLKDTLVVDIAPEAPSPEEIPSACRDIMLEYVNHVTRLGESLFEIISEMLGLRRDRLKAAKCTEEMTVGCHYYFPAPDSQPIIGNVSHCDPSFLTVLLQDQLGGLQFLHQQTWVDIPPLHGALLVNTGVLLQLITNDQIKSVAHRVLVRNASPRTSVACLYGSPSSKSLHGPLKEFILTEGHAVYKSITTKEYYLHILTNLKDFTAGLQGFKLHY